MTIDLNNPKEGTIDYEMFVFKGGEPHIKLNMDTIMQGEDVDVTINTRIKSFNDLGKLAVTVDALQRVGVFRHYHLKLDYFPGARQDRVAVPGEALTVAVYADMINNMEFNSVTIVDPHSNVTPALIHNCIVKTNEELVIDAMEHAKVEKNVVFFIPDAGASLKARTLAAKIMAESDLDITLIQCSKQRNVKTGKLTGFVCDWDVIPLDAVHFVIDDICDGGGTFIGQAQAIKEAFGDIKLNLVVTHGIFSNGFKALESEFENIYTTDSWDDYFLSWKMNYNAHKGHIPKLICFKHEE